MLNEILFEYQNLVYKVDSLCQKLEQLHQRHLVCRPGCSQCCEVERTVLPIEAYVVEQRLRMLSPERIKRLRKLHHKNDDVCPLLLRDRCVIYAARPIICRTHGLPILYREAARSFVDYCRLNFTKLPQTHIFQANEILDMNDFNVELIQLDKKFAEYVLRTRWRPDQRRSLKCILFELNAKPRARRSRRRQ